MSNYSEYIKATKENQLVKFFGEVKHTSNKYFTFNRVQDNDNVIVITSNIKMIKGSYVMIVGENKVVYLKDWCVRPVHNYSMGIDAYAVKLNRKYFKPYTFKNVFDDYIGTEDMDFDYFVTVAKEQDELNLAFASGHMNS